MSTGYVVASFDLKSLHATVPGYANSFELKVGSEFGLDGKISLSPAPRADIPVLAAGKAILLKLNYDAKDIVQKPDGQGLVQVSAATIEQISFMDEDDNLRLGSLFDPSQVQARRTTFRKESLVAAEFPRKYVVLRAMSKEANHLFAMDYAYISSASVTKAVAKRVVDAYLSGDRSRILSSTEKALMLCLDHAATMALSYSEPQHVTVAMVDNKHLFKAANPGEFFYDADRPLKTESLIDVSAEGVPSLAATSPAKQRLLAPTL